MKQGCCFFLQQEHTVGARALPLSKLSFLHFDYVHSKVNDAYYNLIIALLSCLSGIESVMEKAPDRSSTASCCAVIK